MRPIPAVGLRDRMTQTPATARTVFPEISSRAWEHPADRTALTALRRLKGFDQILKVLSAMLRERQHRLLYLASSAQAGPRQFADLDALLDDCVLVLDAPAKPELFVIQSPFVSEYAIDQVIGVAVHRRHLGHV